MKLKERDNIIKNKQFYKQYKSWVKNNTTFFIISLSMNKKIDFLIF